MKPHYAWKSGLSISLVAYNYCPLLKIEGWLNTNTGELKNEWVTKQDQLQIRPKWNMECRRVVHTTAKVPHSAKIVNLKKILGGEEHPGLCFPAHITVAESSLAFWICVQPSRRAFVTQHSEIQCEQPQAATLWFCQSQIVPSLSALLMWASWHDTLNFLVF